MEATVRTTVCDLGDDQPAVRAINWQSGQGMIQNDLCAEHISMLKKNGHAPRRGRKPATTLKLKTAERKAPVKKKGTARNGRRKKSSAKRKPPAKKS